MRSEVLVAAFSVDVQTWTPSSALTIKGDGISLMGLITPPCEFSRVVSFRIADKFLEEKFL